MTISSIYYEELLMIYDQTNYDHRLNSAWLINTLN